MKTLGKYFSLFLSILLFSLGNLQTGLCEQSRMAVTSILQLDAAANPRILKLGDADALAVEVDDMMYYYNEYIGLTSDDQRVFLLVDSVDFSQVDMSREGQYQMEVSLQIDSDFSDPSVYYLPQEFSHFSIPIYVSDPSYFDIFVHRVTDNSILGTFLYTLEDAPVEVYYLKDDSHAVSGNAISDNSASVSSSDLTLCTDAGLASASWQSFLISRSRIEQNTDYYFQLRQGAHISNILHVCDTGKEVVRDSVGGNRDGGDVTEDPSGDAIIQPAPDAPSDTDDTDDLPLGSPMLGGIHKPNGSGTGGTSETDEPVGDDSSAAGSETDVSDSEAADDENVTTVPETPSILPQIGSGVYITNANYKPGKENNPNTPTDTTIDISTNTGFSTIENQIGANVFDVKSSKVTESVTDSQTCISASRLSMMIDSYGEYVPFSQNEMTLYLPASYLEALELTQDETFSVELDQTGHDTFRILLSRNGEALTLNTRSKLLLSFDDETPSLLVFEEDGSHIPLSVEETCASCYITKTGVYQLQYAPNASADIDLSATGNDAASQTEIADILPQQTAAVPALSVQKHLTGRRQVYLWTGFVCLLLLLGSIIFYRKGWAKLCQKFKK